MKKPLFLLLALGWLFFAALPQPWAAETISEIRISILSARGKADMWDTVARNLIPVKQGDPYNLESIASAITALRDSRLFESIHVPDPIKNEDGVVLAFELTPFGRIKDIRIKNAFPLFQREVLNVMNINVGDAYQAQQVDAQAERVQKLFRRQGFTNAAVRISSRQDPGDGLYTVHVDIEKGPYQQIRQIRFNGNTHISDARLRLCAKSWRTTLLPGAASRFVTKKLKEDVKAMTALYRKKGFADVRITSKALPYEDGNLVDLVYTIHEGPRYKVVFRGNTALSDQALGKALTLEKDGNQNNFALKRSLRNIKKRYTEEGYPDARITESSDDDGANGDRLVTIKIKEGPKYRVAALHISGNRTLQEKKIRENILTTGNGGIFNEDILADDLKAVTRLYHKEGFPNVRVDRQLGFSTAEDGAVKQAEITIRIQEGERVRVSGIDINGLAALNRETVLAGLSLTPGAWFDRTRLETDAATLEQTIAEAGYPHADVRSDTVLSPDKAGVRITYHVTQGPEVRVGRIFYAGNLRLRKSVLADEMEIAEGEPFSLSKLVASRRNIQGLNAVDTARVRSIGLKSGEAEVDLIVEISEKKPYFVEAGTGYDTERHFHVNAGIGDRNLLGQNLNTDFRAELSQIGYKADLSLTEPRFLSTRFISNTRMFTEEREEFNKDFGIETYGLSQDFLRSFRDNTLRVNFGLSYEFRDQYLTEERDLTDDEASDYGIRHIGMISTGLICKTTDSYVRPRKGVWSSANLDISKGIDDTLDDFIKIRLEARYYYPATEKLTLAVRAQSGYLQPYGTNTRIPEDQLFFLGGTSTVRGFDENMLRFDDEDNAVGGRAMTLASLEARYDIGKRLEAALFYDTGAVRKSQGRSGSDALRSSVGTGLRYQTPVGPIGILYGWKLDPEPGESRGSFHFSMGYTF
ncbi:MAG TPA: outer membrane protein assembly factor BamA [Desulfobacteraceae bacterium]|nr:outer membrane protein assembly factor BamA [Desulfobacteraceae bacterium]